MPSRQEIQWSQLRVGLLVLAATSVLIALIFLMNKKNLLMHSFCVIPK